MNKVVITGMGAITPVGNDVNTFFESLLAGKNGIGQITRFDTEGYKVHIAAEVRNFDPENCMERGDVRKTDLYTQFALGAAQEAMRDAAFGDEMPDSERFGVYIGTGIGGINTFFTESGKLIAGGPRKVSPFFIPMMIGNIAAGRIAIRYNAQGPSLPVVTACASGANAIGEAYRAIRHGYADVIIAGGAEASITPMAVAGFSNMMALSTKNDPQASSLPFDVRRDGFVLGEGAGALILESEAHALARGARIYAEISGYGNSCDAHHITAPHPEALGAAAAIRQAMAEAGIASGRGVYINAHGTGTPLNDAAETKAIHAAFGSGAADVQISSTKSMTGHMLGAAGAVEAIAAVLALRRGMIPPTIGLAEPDPACDLDYVPRVARKANIHAALSTSLGFGGHNACLAFSPYTQAGTQGGSGT